MKKKCKRKCFPPGGMSKILLRMKLMTFFIFVSMLTASASSYSQQTKFTLNLNGVTVREVFKEIELNSKFILLYNEKQLDVNRKVDVSVANESVESILDQTFRETPNTYKIYDRQIVILTNDRQETSVLSNAGVPADQKKQISGTVKDSNGNSLPGVSVVVKGTTIGIVTDVDGKFSLSLPVDAKTLVFSFIGMKAKEAEITGKSTVNIVLAEETIGIEEVVAVGYGVQKKSDLTGSVASFNTKSLQEHPQPNIIQNMQGTVAGLNIAITGSDAEGSSTATTIRGTNSITASNKPLIILDGIPFTGSWSELNPNDIQAIEILKDASSAAIYGARGSNGVILVTTKKGKKEQMTVSYDGFMSMDQAVNIPTLMDGDTYYKYKIEALKAANTTPVTPTNPEPWMGAITATEDRMHKAGLSTDWLKLSLRNGFKQQHNASFRGSVGKTSYYVSLNYTDSKGISLNDKFNRVGFRINFEQELTPWLRFSTNTQFGRYDRSGNEPSFSKAFLMNPLSEAYDSNGNLKLSSWEDSSVTYARNPLSSINEKNSDISQKLITNNVFDVTIPFINGLTYRTDWDRTPVAEIRKVMEADLLYAVDKLPIRTTNNTTISGAVARHYLGELYLAMGNPAKAEEVLKPLVTGTEYSLMTTRFGSNATQPGNAFIDVFRSPLYSGGNKEVLLAFLNTPPENASTGSSPIYLKSTWKNYYSNDADIKKSNLSAPEVVSGTINSIKMLWLVNGGKGAARASVSLGSIRLYNYKGMGAIDDRNSNYAMVWKIYEKNSSGAIVEFLKNGKSVIDTTLSAAMVDDSKTSIQNYKWPSTRKWDYVQTVAANGDADESYNDMVYLRLADTYLLYAEALYKLKNATAVDWINKVRQRSQAVALTANDLNTLGLDLILDERSRELLSEEERRHTLIRVSQENGGDERDVNNYFKKRVRTYNEICGRPARGMNDATIPVLFPIPQIFIDSNTGRVIAQNPGY